VNKVKILLLRGVNVGGANRLGMPEFRIMLDELGLKSVETYIQSGNAAFVDPGLGDVAALIAEAMRPRFGFAPAMFLYDLAQYQKILAANPFATKAGPEGAAVHIHFLSEPAKGLDLAALRALAKPGEEIAQTDAAIYLCAPDGVGGSAMAAKLAAKVSVLMTARNQRSAQAVLAMAKTITT